MKAAIKSFKYLKIDMVKVFFFFLFLSVRAHPNTIISCESVKVALAKIHTLLNIRVSLANSGWIMWNHKPVDLIL